MRLYFILLICFLCIAAAPAPASKQNEDGSFKLTEESQSFLGIKFLKLDSSSNWEIPASALVQIKFTRGVYRRYDGDITFVMVKARPSKNGYFFITSEDLEAGDEVAVEGVKYLRMTEADLKSGTVDSCAH